MLTKSRLMTVALSAVAGAVVVGVLRKAAADPTSTLGKIGKSLGLA